ncbi:hypothetical protein G5I_11192 [Acromyrmex echinatior]|uniref:Uncharacterized protein n=1 Tax=Acromyrmex echinatior TaxID=103372 RepID=F4WYX8_ACREC|nr:hypothetical protein G5I_11192 [Acromyrmex echinatior]
MRPRNARTTRHSPAIVPADMLIAVVTVNSVARRLTVSSRRSHPFAFGVANVDRYNNVLATGINQSIGCGVINVSLLPMTHLKCLVGLSPILI